MKYPDVRPIATESRICFGLNWYEREEDAIAVGAAIAANGGTVNGGFMDGMPCDRAPAFDRTDADGHRIFAVMVP